jgi:hypothetical protein
MTILILPDLADAKDMIADYLATLPTKPLTPASRQQIIDNCVIPITLLIQAVEMVGAAGPVEEEVFIQFIRALYSQVETRTRQKYFDDLLHKLTACRRMH